MRPLIFVLALILGACSPGLNWREVRTEPDGVRLLLPCKPDRGSRVVPFAGRDTELTLTGCDAAGLTFALASARLADMTQADAVLGQWRALTLAHVAAADARTLPQRPEGALDLPQSVRASASGRAPGGAAVQSEAMYFAYGDRVYQAVVYGPRRDAVFDEACDTFFSSLRLR